MRMKIPGERMAAEMRRTAKVLREAGYHEAADGNDQVAAHIDLLRERIAELQGEKVAIVDAERGARLAQDREVAKAQEALGYGIDDARWRPGETAVDALIRENARLTKELTLERGMEFGDDVFRFRAACVYDRNGGYSIQGWGSREEPSERDVAMMGSALDCVDADEVFRAFLTVVVRKPDPVEEVVAKVEPAP